MCVCVGVARRQCREKEKLKGQRIVVKKLLKVKTYYIRPDK